MMKESLTISGINGLDRSQLPVEKALFKGVAEIFESEARGVVSGSRFDILGMYDDFLSSLRVGGSIFKVYDEWQPDIDRDIRRHGGSDCFGLAKTIQRNLKLKDVEAELVPFDTKGLPAKEASEITDGIGSVGVVVHEGDKILLIEPGFAQTRPVSITLEKPIDSVKIDGRVFDVDFDFNVGKGKLKITSSYHPKKEIGFSLEVLDSDQLEGVQKKYIQIRPTVHCDRFNEEGEKIASLKIKLLNEKICIFTNGKSQEINFADWQAYDFHELSEALGIDNQIFSAQIGNVVRYAGQIRALWPESLIRQYFETTKKAELYDGLRSWEEVNREGYIGGGVVGFVVNDKKQILMYEVPQSREKPKIGRFAGQLNTLVETAESEHDQLPKEDFSTNLVRGIKEELGVDAANIKVVEGSYRETDYGISTPEGKKILARCCVLKWNGSDDESQFTFQANGEGGKWKWVNLDEVLSYEIEPNVRPILERYILEDLI